MSISKDRALVLISPCGIPGYLPKLMLGLFVVVCFCATSYAQTITGTISARVTDQNGAAVPAADVTLTNDQTNDQRNQPTNESGRFSFASVQPGVYTIKIEHQGF